MCHTIRTSKSQNRFKGMSELKVDSNMRVFGKEMEAIETNIKLKWGRTEWALSQTKHVVRGEELAQGVSGLSKTLHVESNPV
jgi:hypothetical protein